MSIQKADKHAKIKNFIQCYRDLPVLWNTKAKEYFDKEKKTEAYVKLTALYQEIEPGSTVDDVKKKINVLRTNYRRESKKMLMWQTLGRTLQPSWTFNELKFLDDYYEQVNKSVKVSSPKMKEELVWELNYGNDSPGTYYQHEEQELNMENDHEDVEQPQCTKKFKTNESNLTCEGHSCSRVMEETEENITAKNWSMKLARLKPDQKIWAEKFINDILTEGELGTLHRHFMSSISPKMA